MACEFVATMGSYRYRCLCLLDEADLRRPSRNGPTVIRRRPAEPLPAESIHVPLVSIVGRSPVDRPLSEETFEENPAFREFLYDSIGIYAHQYLRVPYSDVGYGNGILFITDARAGDGVFFVKDEKTMRRPPTEYEIGNVNYQAYDDAVYVGDGSFRRSGAWKPVSRWGHFRFPDWLTALLYQSLAKFGDAREKPLPIWMTGGDLPAILDPKVLARGEMELMYSDPPPPPTPPLPTSPPYLDPWKLGSHPTFVVSDASA